MLPVATSRSTLRSRVSAVENRYVNPCVSIACMRLAIRRPMHERSGELTALTSVDNDSCRLPRIALPVPVPATERLETLDVLRGFALLESWR